MSRQLCRKSGGGRGRSRRTFVCSRWSLTAEPAIVDCGSNVLRTLHPRGAAGSLSFVGRCEREFALVRQNRISEIRLFIRTSDGALTGPHLGQERFRTIATTSLEPPSQAVLDTTRIAPRNS